MGSLDVPLDDERTQLDAFVEECRSALEVTLGCLTEEQARRHLVSSATTLLGLLKHVTWMQRVWFEESVGGTSRRGLGLVQNPEESFRLTDDDTVASVTAAHREACATARTAVAGLPLDAVVTGHRACCRFYGVPLLDNVRPVLDPGEHLQYALTGQTGINPSFLWLPILRWLVVTNRARIIVITDRRIAVFAAGQLRWSRNKPRRLLFSLPRQTRLDHGQGSRSKIAVGAESIWVSRAAYPFLDEANETTGPAPTDQ